MRGLFVSSVGSLLAVSVLWSLNLAAQRSSGAGGADLSSGPYEPVTDWPIHD